MKLTGNLKKQVEKAETKDEEICFADFFIVVRVSENMVNGTGLMFIEQLNICKKA